ncbi:hypothetical protein Afil01_37490 [Actinorhabdospora filicis]|uniref:Uncharacterized protein n=1 Tax=Actinorhabdospora filicis TaxID=1785913 RepID=A0A9W6SN45_9ACTN|nr:hypothetical protein [Actinorhabdospora filicis]GLZ78942.1 hypothetical protein Afil01_37490 [Actinorhabdospora filicis]
MRALDRDARVVPRAEEVHRRAPADDRRGLLRLQAMAGNAAVTALLQRCGDEVHDGCPCAGERAPVVSRQPDAGTADAGAPKCRPPGTRRAGNDADSVDQAVRDGCVDEAFGILNGHAIFGLLPLLAALIPRGSFPALKAAAGGMGGPRMTTAITVAELKAKGGTIGAAELRPVIDLLGVWSVPDRRDALDFLGKLVVINVRGLDLDFSYCAGATGPGCVPEVEKAIAWAKKMQGEYAACRAIKGLKDGDDVDNAVFASLKKQGINPTVAGQTSPTGVVTITPKPMSKCQPILIRGTEIHEAVHQKTTVALQKKFGAGTPAFDKQFFAPAKWIQDDINAYGAEIPFYEEVLQALALLEGKMGP